MNVVSFSEIWFKILLLSLGAYVFGNFNGAIFLSKIMGDDIRKRGSGNPGTMNVIRNFGFKLGGLTLLFDAGKGFVAAMTGALLFNGYITESGMPWSDLTLYVAGFFAVIGHILPIIHHFRGGKGIATTIGIFLWVQPIVAIFVFIIIALYIYRYEFGSVGSLGFVTFMCAFEIIVNAILYSGNYSVELFLEFAVIVTLCIMTFLSHRENIARLIYGSEHRTKLKKILKKEKRKAERKRKALLAKLGKGESHDAALPESEDDADDDDADDDESGDVENGAAL